MEQPNSLTRGLPPHPPRPALPQPKPWGRGGAKRVGRVLSVFRRVGEAGFAAQPTIEHRGISKHHEAYVAWASHAVVVC